MELLSRDAFRSSWDTSSVSDAMLEISACLVPLWVAVLVGLFVGWVWKPRWVSFLFLGLKSRPRLLWTSPPGFGARRIWLAMTAFTAFQMLKEYWVKFKARKWPKTQLGQLTENSDAIESHESLENEPSGLSNLASSVVGDEDLKDLKCRLDYKDGGLSWELMMERATSGLTYKAWRRDPQGGPTEYRSCTVFEDATPALVKDFYWDDEFRNVWDDMILYTKSLDECPKTGSEIVHWIRKFPLFCSNREYVIGRRIFESGDTYFCITKTVPYSAIPKNSTPWRVDVYFSSWCIRAVESPKNKGQGQRTACEVTFFHSEDLGIPKGLAKFGIQNGMWGCVKKIERGYRKYEAFRKVEPLSHSARMAQIITKVTPSFLEESGAIVPNEVPTTDSGNGHHTNCWRWLIVGGAVILACGLDRGVVSRVLVFGVARRLSKLGRRL